MKTTKRARRWPTTQEVVENAKRGLVEEASLEVPLLDLDESQILGEPTPKLPTAKSSGKKRKPAA